MTHPAPEDPLAALREEIRRAGRRADLGCLQYMVGFGLVMPLAGGLLIIVLTMHGYLSQIGFNLLIGLGVIGVSAAFPLAFARRRRWHVRLRQRLAGLPTEAAWEVLAPLRTDESMEARDIALALLHDLDLPTELTPAVTPDGSGAEVSGLARSEDDREKWN